MGRRAPDPSQTEEWSGGGLGLGSQWAGILPRCPPPPHLRPGKAAEGGPAQPSTQRSLQAPRTPAGTPMAQARGPAGASRPLPHPLRARAPAPGGTSSRVPAALTCPAHLPALLPRRPSPRRPSVSAPGRGRAGSGERAGAAAWPQAPPAGGRGPARPGPAPGAGGEGGRPARSGPHSAPPAAAPPILPEMKRPPRSAWKGPGHPGTRAGKKPFQTCSQRHARVWTRRRRAAPQGNTF